MSDKVKNQISLPNFIVDLPSSEDDFGAHGRLADVIAAIIQKDRRIKTIGILGGWGSGKSTVVRLIEERFKPKHGKQKLHAFTYDAWIHQSDPPRRSFLEALLASLKRRKAAFGLSDEQIAAWRKQLGDMEGETRKTNTTVTPTLTGVGKWYLFMLVLIPIGLKLVGEGTKEHPLTRTQTILAWGLSLAPLIAVVVIYMSWRPRAWPWTSKFWFTHRKEHENESVLSIVANKHVEVKDELTIKEPEPTAIEFQNIFRDIMAKVQIADRRLVVVVDNLDRLPVDEALKLWATVRSFFLGSGEDPDRPNAANLPTVIVPVDDQAFSRIYAGQAKNGDGPIIARSFVEKTFDLVFHVPPPVLSKWHLYLKQRLEAVFEANLEAHWPYAIGTVYEDWLGRNGLPTAPRSMNSFVNNIAVRWTQAAGEEIHIGVIAYYVLNQQRIDENIYKAVTDPLTLLDGFDADWHLSIAALHFGVGLEDTKELFMEGPLRTAIAARDEAKFKELASVPGFDRYLFHVLDAALLNTNASDEFSAFAAATLMKFLPETAAPWVTEAWRKIRNLAISPSTSSYRAGDREGLTAIFNSCSGPERNLFVRALGASLQKHADQTLEIEDKGRPLMEAARLTIEQAHAAGLEDFLMEIKGGVATYAAVIQHEAAESVVRAIIPEGRDFQELITYLAPKLTDIFEGHAVTRVAAAVALHDLPTLNWSPLLRSAEELFQTSVVARVGAAAALFQQTYGRVAAIRKSLMEMAANGVLQNAFDTAWSGESDEELARVSSLILMADGPLRSSSGTDWNSQLELQPELPRLIEQFLAEMGRPTDLRWLLKRSETHSEEVPLLRALAARILDHDGELDVTAKELLDAVSQYRNLIPTELQAKFWGKASATPEFWTQLNSQNYDNALPVLHALIASDINKAQLGKSLKARLHSTSAEQWEEALDKGEEPMGLVDALTGLKGSSVDAGANAFAQLRAMVDQLTEDEDDEFTERWFRVAFRLSSLNRKTLFRTLRDRLVSGAAVTNLPALLSAGGRDLLSDGEFAKKPDDAILHLAIPMLTSAEGQAWLIDNVEEVAVWLGRTREADASTFRSQLARLADENQLQSVRLVGELART
jgi:hypothetical protein